MNHPHCTVDVWGVLDLAGEGPVVGELDLLHHDGGITAHHVSGPGDPLPEDSFLWRIRPLVEVEHLKRDTFTSRGFTWPRSVWGLSDPQMENQTLIVQTSFLTQHFRDIFNKTPKSLRQNNSSFSFLLQTCVFSYRLFSSGFQGPEAPGDDDGGGVDGRRSLKGAFQTNVCSIDGLHVSWGVDTHSSDLKHPCNIHTIVVKLHSKIFTNISIAD